MNEKLEILRSASLSQLVYYVLAIMVWITVTIFVVLKIIGKEKMNRDIRDVIEEEDSDD